MAALAQRGWSLACVESGLDGELLRRLGQAGQSLYRGGKQQALQAGSLEQAAETIRREFKTSVGLAVALSISGESQEISITIITPLGQRERQLSYGGHPKNAVRWALNNAIDWLRRIAQEAG